jgi:tripartite-type tricarboxylate transporter receptor subunit TctC
MTRIATLVVLFGMAWAAAFGVHAQSYPNRPIRLVVPYPPGGTADLLARVLGQRLGETLGQPIIIEDRGGAGGNIATDLVAKSAPDGYTLLMANASVLAINPTLFGSLPFDPVRDFAPISLVADVPLILVVHPSLPVKSVKELVALAKARPGEINYAAAGLGSTTHLSMELFKTMAGVKIVTIPFKGSGPALAALIAGQVPVMFELFPTALGFVKSGKLRPLAVTSSVRSPLMPELPTVAETGLPGFEVASWFGVVAPADTPKEIVARLNADIVRIVSSADMRERLAGLGAEPHANSPEQFSQFILTEFKKWAQVIKDSGAHVE